MFQIGLFTTHLPYILIIVFYAAAVLFPPSHKEASFGLNTSVQEHNCLASCKTPLYHKENPDRTCEKNNLQMQENLFGIPGKVACISPTLFGKFNFRTCYNNSFANTFLSENIPNRAPPTSLLPSVV